MGTRPKLTPNTAYKLAAAIHQAGGEVDHRLEAIIASDPKSAYGYARDVLKTSVDKDRFEEVQQQVQAVRDRHS